MPLFKRKSEVSSKIISPSLWENDANSASSRLPNGTVYSQTNSDSSLLQEQITKPFLSEAEENFNSGSPMKTKSRLSKTLHEVLHDHGALAYFIQFMEAHNAKHFVKFWIEAESFLVSARTRLKDQIEHDKCALTEKVSGSVLHPEGRDSDKSKGFLASQHHNETNEEGTFTVFSEDTSFKDKQLKSFLNNFEKDKTSHSLTKQTVSEVKTSSENNHPLRVPLENVNNDDKTYDAQTELKKYDSTVNNVNNKIVPSVNEKLPSESEDKQKFHNSSENNDSNMEGILQSCRKEMKAADANIDMVPIERNIQQDAIHIYSKYIAQDAPHLIDISVNLRNEIIANICKENGEVDPESFVPAQKFVVEKMDKEYFPAFLRSTFHCNHQIDVITSGSVYLADVLYNDSALFYFMEYMEQEGVRHLVDFLLIADNFRNQYLAKEGQFDGLQAQDDAMVLYDKYFSLQATSSLGFSDQIRCEIEQNICQAEGPSPDCFLKPVTILMQHLEKIYLPQFLTSQLCFNYLSECMNTIQNGGDLVSQRKRSGSESSSEHSIPIQTQTINTLLVMDSKQPGVIVQKFWKNIEDQDMRIDTGQFHPDALWKRQLAGKLQMAHIDEYGKLTTEFQPEPDRKTGSRISKAVKRLVNWEEDKSQEDMAWQIAVMIVKDICDITMGQDTTIKNSNNGCSGVS
ncbi:A-kinase anchor protein 10, mitochondrial [Centruroides vittatus]|uniref:A-kinase anchor protein 10, mitochondrial n=1 Tax=Centruroides vittatus TaxID=120091 RepID=UPI00350F895C